MTAVLQLNPDPRPQRGEGGRGGKKSSKGAIKCHIITLTDQITEQVDVFLSPPHSLKAEVKYDWEYG